MPQEYKLKSNSNMMKEIQERYLGGHRHGTPEIKAMNKHQIIENVNPDARMMI